MTKLLPHITLEIGKSPQHSIIWLHGLGASGDDFVPFAHEMKLLQAVRYIFPHAPRRPVTLNGGYMMPAWYDIVGLTANARQDTTGIRVTQLEIEKLIEQQKQLGIPAKNIFLAGFSQGGAIALHTGLRTPEPLGGIIALSTYLPLAQTLSAEKGAGAKATPIFMAHGRDDSVVPYPWGKFSADLLTQSGFQLEWHEYAMPHTVNNEEMRDLQAWLSKRMAELH
jgi:phospholipase/carboxylesterase